MSKRHEVHLFSNGTASIRNLELNETMHSSIGPEEEARLVYLDQSRIGERLKLPNKNPLVLYDVGLGIATNALCALELADVLRERRPLHIVSFENTLEGLELALEDPERFPQQRRHEKALRSLMQSSVWESEGIRWELRPGDFLSARLEPSPEIVFFDFYSPSRCPRLWTQEVFARIAASTEEVTLVTYSAATSVRQAMAAAGFRVERGRGTSLKKETTIAVISRS